MRLVDYFRGYRRTMTSPLPPHVVEQRINESTLSIWRPFTRGITGWARFGRLRLRYRHAFWRYDGQPILAGRIIEGNRGSRLDLNYRAPLSILAFYVFWYLFLLLFALTFLLSAEWSTPVPPADTLLLALGLVFFMAFPLGMHFIFTAKADAELDEIIAFLEREVQAIAVPSGMMR